MSVVEIASSPGRADIEGIGRALALMTDGVFEIRIPKAGRHRTIRGYFNDAAAAARAAAAWSGKVPAVYVTLNPVNPALLARASNRMESYAESTTSDADILSRRWLLIDIDPKRPAGISSSDSEHAASLAKADEIAEWLKTRGWPAPVYADSGNGAHLLYRVALSNEAENTAVIERALKALAARFDSAAVGVDTGVANASRISKLYGTYACKGDSTSDRPHRLSRILRAPTEIECVSLESLDELAALAPAPPSRSAAPFVAPRSGDFFANTNEAAISRLNAWVPRLFPDARPYRNGFRVTSRNLRRDREEDLGIQPDGIKDFGVHDMNDPQGGCRTPIDLVLEWGSAADAKEAALWLCDQIGVSPDMMGWRKQEKPRETQKADATKAEAEPPNPEPPIAKEFICLADFIAKPPESSYLIKTILPARGIGQVFGEPNVGKSFLLIDIAMHLASGTPWLGKKTKKVCVLYIAAEGLGGLSGRMLAWTRRHGIVPDLLFVRPYSAQLTVQGAAAALAEKIAGLPISPKLVILDTLAANFGPGNENDAQDMATAMNGLRYLAGDWLSLCVHHSGHADKTRSRGHSSLYAALDIEMKVSRDDPLGPIKVCHTKCRDMERMEPVFFNLEKERLPWADEDGEPIDSAVLIPADVQEKPETGTARIGGKQAQALQVLRELYEVRERNLRGEGTPRVTIAEWYAEMDFERDTGHRTRIRASLEKSNAIRTENGFVYLN